MEFKWSRRYKRSRLLALRALAVAALSVLLDSKLRRNPVLAVGLNERRRLASHEVVRTDSRAFRYFGIRSGKCIIKDAKNLQIYGFYAFKCLSVPVDCGNPSSSARERKCVTLFTLVFHDCWDGVERVRLLVQV